MLAEELKDRAELFKNKSYLYFTLSGFCATLGNGLNYIALSWLAYKINGTVSGVAMMMFFIWMPSIIFAPIFGNMSDKYSRKKMMVISNIGRGIPVLGYVILWSQNLQPELMLLCTVLGVFLAFYMPAAVPFVQSIVHKKQLVSANATIDMVYEFGTIIGMGVSGILIISVGMKGTLMIGGILFVLAGIFNILMQTPQKNKSVSIAQSWWKDYLDSLHYVRKKPSLFFTHTNQMVMMVLLGTIPVILVPYSKEVLDTDAHTFALYEALYSMGVLLGGFFSPALCRKFTTKYTLAFLFSLISAGLYILSINTSVGIVFPIYFIVGFGVSGWALSVTLVQLACDPDYQGRLQATFNGLSGLIILALYLVMAEQGAGFSSQRVYLTQSILCICSIAFILLSKKSYAYDS